MYQNRLLCYKVSYCLGVEDYVLARDFHGLHEIAKEIGYFDSCPIANKYRALSRVFYMVTRHYEMYAPGKSFGSVAGNRFKPFLKGTGISPETIYKDSADVSDFLSKIAGMSQKLLPALYDELKPATDYLSFISVLKLEAMSEPVMKKVQYILRRLPPTYCVYFFGSDLYNVLLRFVRKDEEVTEEKGANGGEGADKKVKTSFVMDGLLRSDPILRKSISVATSRPVDRCTDTSTLATELSKRDDGHFVTAADIGTTFKNLFMLQSGLSNDAQATVLSMFAEETVPITAVTDIPAFIELWNKREDIHTNTVLLCRGSEEDVNTILEACPGISMCMLVPISGTLYKAVLSGKYERINLLSTR